MDIEKEIKAIVEKKEGNKEMAFFYEDGEWDFELGNPTNCVRLGEASGELTTSGGSLTEVIHKMKAKLGI